MKFIGQIILETVIITTYVWCLPNVHVHNELELRASPLKHIPQKSSSYFALLFALCQTWKQNQNTEAVLQSDDFFNSLYFCPWFDQSPPFKKTFHFCQTISIRPLVVNATLVPANLHTFVNVRKNQEVKWLTKYKSLSCLFLFLWKRG